MGGGGEYEHLEEGIVVVVLQREIQFGFKLPSKLEAGHVVGPGSLLCRVIASQMAWVACGGDWGCFGVLHVWVEGGMQSCG